MIVSLIPELFSTVMIKNSLTIIKINYTCVMNCDKNTIYSQPWHTASPAKYSYIVQGNQIVNSRAEDIKYSTNKELITYHQFLFEFQ